MNCLLLGYIKNIEMKRNNHRIEIHDFKGKKDKYKVRVVAGNSTQTGGDRGFNSAAAVNVHLRSNNRTCGGFD